MNLINKRLLERFKEETYQSIREGISLNPILNSFQYTVNRFNIENSPDRTIF